MIEANNYREASKLNWAPKEAPPSWTMERINAGSLQRIADAVEKMAGSYQTLINERDNYKRWVKQAEDRSEKLQHSNNALRGVIKKLKGAQ